ncbi:MAG TPA: DUF1573 domain-containing protein [Chryseosolibacter sp.]|nr:DUF1573 domain-containing protein [Chryseosolibacter sp.]
MKTIAVTFIMLCFSYASRGQGTASTAAVKHSATAAFSWGNTSHDFGKTKVGQPLTYEFRFTNTGMAPLIISSVKASCGCTVTAYTKDPVEHGTSGFVRATYDAQKPGVYSKTVAVYANTPEGMISLTIKGEIVR